MRNLQFASKGYATGVSYLDTPVTTQVRIASTSNYWSSVEYNTNNAAISNFSNGTLNNNNRYNSNYVRAVADLDAGWKESWYNAYATCCKNKLHSGDCCEFRVKKWEQLYKLMVDVWNFNYEPTTSKTFCVTRPKVREIFAASFIDRIAQHWVINIIEPLLEEVLIEAGNISYNCRKGYGTLRCIKDFSSDIEDVANREINAELQQSFVGEIPNENAMRSVAMETMSEMYVVRIDIQSFFMTIDKGKLISRLLNLIDERYHGPWKKHLLYLSRLIVSHRPQDDCVRRGDLSLWKVLPRNKSLFCVDGMPIGNITSQQLANFVLAIVDAVIKKWATAHGGCVKRFVDDIPCVIQGMGNVHKFIRLCDESVRTLCGQCIHPNKIYIQPLLHGFYFIGSIIKPYISMVQSEGANMRTPKLMARLYISNRTREGFNVAIRRLLSVLRQRPSIATLFIAHRAVASVNAYIGLMVHQRTHKIRSRLLSALCRAANKIYPPLIPLYVKNNYTTLRISRRYEYLCLTTSQRDFSASCEPSCFSAARHKHNRRRKNAHAKRRCGTHG